MKRKVTWWQAIILIAGLLTGIYFTFARLETSNKEERDQVAGDAFAGTTVGRVAVTVSGRPSTKLAKIVTDTLDEQKLLEKDMSPEALQDIRRNDDVCVYVESKLQGEESTWVVWLEVQRDINIQEGGSLLGGRRVRVAQRLLGKGGRNAPSEDDPSIEKAVADITMDLVKHLSAPSNGPTPARLKAYGSGTSQWNYQRLFKADEAPKGATQFMSGGGMR